MIRQFNFDQYIRESNAIEGIGYGPGQPLYDDHLAACRYVWEWCANTDGLREPPPPAVIHGVLMASEPHVFPGEYRQVRVTVGPYEKVAPVAVRPAMQALRSIALAAARHPADELGLWALHYRFEAIHPFLDGNGRTGRLWLNALRMTAGLPWVIVPVAERFDYYDAIREWETDGTTRVPRGVTVFQP